MYSLKVIWLAGHETIIDKGYNPISVRASERTVSRNRDAIRRIELHDLDGCLETIWASDWEKFGGVDP